MGVSFRHKGNFEKTNKLLTRMVKSDIRSILDQYGRAGVEALSAATPIDTGVTSSSWSYTVESRNGRHTISWSNSNINNGVPIAIILQYGHGTGTGGFVQGVDYINPALAPVFQQLANNAWKEMIG